MHRGAVGVKFGTGILIEALLVAMVMLSTLDFLSSMGPDYHARGDDPTYIAHALEQRKARPVWGPIYTSTLALFVDHVDTTNRRFVCFIQVLFTALIASFYLALRTGAVPVGSALLFTMLLVLSGINPYRMEEAHIGSSFISHLALLFILVAVMVANRVPATDPNRVGIIAFGLFLASYIRPELLVACIILSALYLWLIFRPQARALWYIHRKWYVSSGILAAALWAWAWGGLPMGGPGSEARQVMAFGQHFAVNLRQWEPDQCPDDKNPWADWEYYANAHFGDARGILDSMLANPTTFARHVLRNLVNLGRVIWRTFLDYPLLVSTDMPWRILNWGLLALALYLVYPGNGNTSVRKRYPRILPVALIITLPSLLSSLLLYPRDHYVIFLGAISLLGVALTFYRGKRPRSPGADIPLLACGLFLAAMHFTPRGGIPTG